MSDLTVFFPQETNVVYFPQVVHTIFFPACPPAGGSIDLAALTALLNQYPAWPNDTEARKPAIDGGGGLTTGDLYWYSEDTDTGIYDTLKRVSPL